MRTIKYHLALTDNEYSLIINSLNNLRNDLIAQGRYTDYKAKSSSAENRHRYVISYTITILANDEGKN